MHVNNKPVAVLMGLYHKDSISSFDKALYSLLIQEFVDVFLFVHIDGPVSAELIDACEKYRTRGLKINIIQSEQNVGLAVGLNKLIDEVYRTMPDVEFIARFDSDDICVEDRLIKQVRYLCENEQVGVLGTACFEFTDDLNNISYIKRLPVSDSEIKRMLSHGCPFIHPTVMFRKRIFDTGFRYPNIRLSEDLALWFLLRNHGIVFANLAEPLVYYRLSDKTVERRLGIRKGIDEFRIRIKNLNFYRDGLISFLLIISRLFVHILPLKFFKKLRKVYLSNYE